MTLPCLNSFDSMTILLEKLQSKVSENLPIATIATIELWLVVQDASNADGR
jgi:hypothetical protein